LYLEPQYQSLKEYFAGLDYYFLCQSFSWASANRSAPLAVQVSKIKLTSSQAYDYNHLMCLWLQLFGSHLLAQLCKLCHHDFLKFQSWFSLLL
jgi:hypothetical protein